MTFHLRYSNIGRFLCGLNIRSIASVCETRSERYGLALRRLEWESCIVPKLRAGDAGFDLAPTSDALPFGFALLAVSRFVRESLLVKELLFS